VTDAEKARLCDTLAALGHVDEEKVWGDLDMAIDHIDLAAARVYGWCT
jgi:hypothetical protein